MEPRGLEIDIELTSHYGDLAAGVHTVRYVACADGTLWCIDRNGEQHALDYSALRFVKVSWFDTRVTQNGRVCIKAGEVWIDLGPLFAGCATDGQIAPQADSEPLEPLPLLEWPWLDEAV